MFTKFIAAILFAVTLTAWPTLNPHRVDEVLRNARATLEAPTATATLAPTITATAPPVIQSIADHATTAEAVCPLDWSLPYTDNNYQQLAWCRWLLYKETGTYVCPPEGVVWHNYFRDAFCAPPEGWTPLTPVLTAVVPIPPTATPPPAYP